MYTLNPDTKAGNLKEIGLRVDEIVNMDIEVIDKHINKLIGKPLTFQSVYDEQLTGRGSVYIALKRLMSVKEADRVIAKI